MGDSAVLRFDDPGSAAREVEQKQVRAVLEHDLASSARAGEDARIRANKKLGMARPTKLITEKIWSPNEYWRVAEKTPIGMAIAQVKAIVDSEMTTVSIIFCAIRSRTGRL